MTDTLMKLLLVLGLILLVLTFVRSSFAQAGNSPRITPTEAAAKVKAGDAVIIDVREPREWENGVASPAYLLPLSDLRDGRRKWGHVLEDAKDKQVLLYCRSGNRSGIAAGILAKEGFDVANVGGFRDWQAADLPVRQPDEPATLE